MKTQPAPRTVDEYIARFPPGVRPLLDRVRGAIREAIPEADELISYGLAGYKLHGRPVIYFGGWKAHYSIYPSTAPLVAAFKKELAPYEVNDKGTIRFPLSSPVPVALIGRLAKFRAKEVSEPAKARAAVRRKRRAP
jgi:uncharacterized protein YdhG (YjbR/CyaY superfamily)